jgi:hypothetical protein
MRETAAFPEKNQCKMGPLVKIERNWQAGLILFCLFLKKRYDYIVRTHTAPQGANHRHGAPGSAALRIASPWSNGRQAGCRQLFMKEEEKWQH